MSEAQTATQAAATEATGEIADALMNCTQVMPEILRCTVVYGA